MKTVGLASERLHPVGVVSPRGCGVVSFRVGGSGLGVWGLRLEGDRGGGVEGVVEELEETRPAHREPGVPIRGRRI